MKGNMEKRVLPFLVGVSCSVVPISIETLVIFIISLLCMNARPSVKSANNISFWSMYESRIEYGTKSLRITVGLFILLAAIKQTIQGENNTTH